MNGSGSATARLLFANGPATDRADKMGLYGWLVGAWKMDAVMRTPDGMIHERQGEIAFAWVLEGRANWMSGRCPTSSMERCCIYNPAIDAWHILWSDPLRQFYNRQIGRARGRDIVQIGRSDDGADTRRCFTEITPDAFRWTGEPSTEGQANWQLQAEFRCRRAACLDLDHFQIYIPSVVYPNGGGMQVAKWGNSLAVRLPAAVVEALELREGDEIEIHVAGARQLGVARKPGRDELLKRLRAFRGRLPADFKFDREEANAR